MSQEGRRSSERVEREKEAKNGSWEACGFGMVRWASGRTADRVESLVGVRSC